jgi:hypothetical protein
MTRRMAMLVAGLVGVLPLANAEEIRIDFEQADIGKPVPSWSDQGVQFKLAAPPARSKAVGRVMFFPHIPSNRKGILNAMATEQAIPVLATLPRPATTVTLVLWASTGCPAQLEALDAQGNVVDKASLAAAPGRKSPEEAVPFFELTVSAPSIAAIRFSGPRDGEFLAADELRFTTLDAK